MNKILILHYLIFISLTCSAQFTLTSNNAIPQAGDSFTFDSIPYTAPGPNGANVTWDFSNATLGGSHTLSWVQANTLPHYSDFSNSDVGYDLGNTEEYFSTSNSSFSREGYVSGNVVIPYSNPEDFLRFPMDFNDTYTDTFAGTFINVGTFDRWGTITTTVDAYGTLILPWGTVNDAMRVKQVEDFQDDYDYNGNTGTYNYDIETYLWYQQGVSYPVMVLYSLVSDAGNSQVGLIMQQTGIGGQELTLKEDFNIYPNPASGEVKLEYGSGFSADMQIQIYSVTGKLIEKVDIPAFSQNGKASFSTERLSSGFYLLQAQTQEESIVRKIQIVKN